VAIATAGDGREVRFHPTIGTEMREALVAKLELVSEIAPALAACSQLLSDLGEIRQEGGPRFVFEAGASAPHTTASAPQILTSAGDPGNSPVVCPQPRWEPHEWEQVLNGSLGPWRCEMAASFPCAIRPLLLAVRQRPAFGRGPNSVASAWLYSSHRPGQPLRLRNSRRCFIAPPLKMRHHER
jgi:hypothetical protein